MNNSCTTLCNAASCRSTKNTFQEGREGNNIEIQLFVPKNVLPLHAGYAYISNLAVAPESRRKGVALQLMAAAEALARDWGCTSSALHCNPHNEAAATMYSKLRYKTSVQEPSWMPILQGRPSERCNLLIKRI